MLSKSRLLLGHLQRSTKYCVGVTPSLCHSSSTNSSYHGSSHGEYRYTGATYGAAAAVGAGVIAVLSYEYRQPGKAACAHKPKHEPGAIVKGLPTYTQDVVAKHNNSENGIWVLYKNGVYDITKFVRWHPGGDKIMLAAGKSLEPFFEIFSIHKTKEVMEMMEEHRIGNILETSPIKVKDAYINDPDRSALLNINSAKPFNAEPPTSLLVDEYITPNAMFFVRNHLPVPKVDSKNVEKNYTLDGAWADGKCKPLTLADLKSMPQLTITATMQCAGNRRAEMSAVKPVKGLSWNSGSISTAKWTGVRLTDVLKRLGFSDQLLSQYKYVQFEGLDCDPTGTPYGSSILMEKAVDPRQEILVAYEMNGESIPSDHGFPLRIVIPGVVGARNVKWLKRIVLSNEESPSHWQRNDYKSFNPSIELSQTNFDASYPIIETPVQSVICEPRPGSVVDADDEYVTVRGYAYSGGGKGIIRVDLSLDGGKTWTNPELVSQNPSPYRSWAWTLWEATVPIPAGSQELSIVCKALDSQHNAQPEHVDGIWNVRGLLNNSWHKVDVKVK